MSEHYLSGPELSESAKAQILVIDDDAEVVESLSTILTAHGYACHGCRSAEAAIEKVQTISPDLILSDINLAGRSGLTLCERLRKDEGLLDVPVMFLSGAQIPDIIRRAHAAGGTYYLRKPFDPGVLLELVDKALWMPHVAANRLIASSR
ncbi:MAG TPA: response regulator [Pirellulales bacterium]|jgi:CheY-like chemotaxis protein|nr:response regulator [Pirellulales bacterium]